MNDSPKPPKPHLGTPTCTLRRLRMEKGQVEIVRTLSESYKGCLTHFYKGRSRYCPGEGLCELHKLDAVWKGYCCVEMWSQAGNFWTPLVLEITESLDQDFYGRFGRAQVWELRYDLNKKTGKGASVRATFWEQLDFFKVPDPYSMIPVLFSTYHHLDVKLNLDNPLPRRLVVPTSPGEAPVRPGPRSPEGPTVQPGEWKRQREENERKRRGESEQAG